MATVVHEIERKHDAAQAGMAALEALKDMAGTAPEAARARTWVGPEYPDPAGGAPAWPLRISTIVGFAVPFCPNRAWISARLTWKLTLFTACSRPWLLHSPATSMAGA